MTQLLLLITMNPTKKQTYNSTHLTWGSVVLVTSSSSDIINCWFVPSLTVNVKLKKNMCVVMLTDSCNALWNDYVIYWVGYGQCNRARHALRNLEGALVCSGLWVTTQLGYFIFCFGHVQLEINRWNDLRYFAYWAKPCSKIRFKSTFIS